MAWMAIGLAALVPPLTPVPILRLAAASLESTPRMRSPILRLSHEEEKAALSADAASLCPPHEGASTLSSHVGEASLSPQEEEAAVRQCATWIDQHVIRLGLCPYAAKPFASGQIRYAVSAATTDQELLLDFFVEGRLLLDAAPSEVATTMLIAPNYPADIESFYALYEWLVDTLESEDEEELNNGIQPAFFHPRWSFSELEASSPVHFEKRAPVPVINLLRRADLDDVVQTGLERGVIVNKQIAEHNAEALEAEGYERLSAVFRTHLGGKPESHP